MSVLKKVCMLIFILSFLSFLLQGAVFAGQQYYLARSGSAGVTIHLPEMLAPPEADIPKEKIAKKTNPWLYVLGGIAVVGGALAAAGGGGGGGGDSGPTTGDVTVTW